MYFADCTRPDIEFLVNLLTRYSSTPSQRHWNRIKQVPWCLGLFYSKWLESQLFGYVDANYLSDSHKARSQTWYIFSYGGTIISWKSIKQIMETCGPPSIKGNATKLYEDNVACIA